MKNERWRKINKKSLHFLLSAYGLLVFLSLAIVMLIVACLVPCTCWKNILLSLGTGILSSFIVTLVIEIYKYCERRLNKTIYVRHFYVVSALSVWYLKNISIMVGVTLNVDLNFVCFSMSDINKHIFKFKGTLSWLHKFFEVSDKRMVKLIDDFASRKFNLSTRDEDKFLNYFKSYNNLKNHIADYKYMSKEQIEGCNKDFNDLFDKFLTSVSALLNDLNVKFTVEDFSNADNYINKWVTIDKNLDILLDKNDFIEISKEG